MRSLIAAVALSTALSTLSAPFAVGEESTMPISVTVNMARVLRISEPAATIIIGNPAIADVVIQDPQTLVLTGKGFGQTNLIVLDAAGEPIADTLLEVVTQTADNITVFQGREPTTLACNPTCKPTIMVGDSTNFTSNAIASSLLVQNATGQ
ncbi:hypothetical protein GCM10007989_30040 [Devosia pacifica]|uniref:Pilus formation protein N-terminal domain-containing protein n=1 Tax=Devosia pacifica TaxID=1335967 RepID=A0A918SB42_9HYPH|nr:pilus assembly protein N-terminal domain-containing protein [Devosia pacifica]GHA31965.1 hypothetical protein GCM10007989_30040 [Devosia pacifica]